MDVKKEKGNFKMRYWNWYVTPPLPSIEVTFLNYIETINNEEIYVREKYDYTFPYVDNYEETLEMISIQVLQAIPCNYVQKIKVSYPIHVHHAGFNEGNLGTMTKIFNVKYLGQSLEPYRDDDHVRKYTYYFKKISEEKTIMEDVNREKCEKLIRDDIKECIRIDKRDGIEPFSGWEVERYESDKKLLKDTKLKLKIDYKETIIEKEDC